MSILASVPLAPRDPILGLTEQFLADTRPGKVNLGVGVYLDQTGKVPLLDCVRTAEARIAAAPSSRSYLPIDGLAAYDTAVRELTFGTSVAADRVTTVQALGGTGGLKLGAEFLRTTGAGGRVLISDPSWENHLALFTRAGYDVEYYRYYDRARGGVDFAGMLDDLRAAAPGSIVVLHGCCHNPTGYDLSGEQWEQVIAVVAERGLVPFVDLAYQGFSQGLDPDGAVPRRFAESDIPVLVATSFSKSFSLYGERVGSLSVVSADAAEAARVLSQVKVAVRTLYSNPPTHGAAVVAAVLSDPDLRAQWETELAGMRERIKTMRRALLAGLEAEGVHGWEFITEQVGMFSYTGLSSEQMRVLREGHAVYGTDAGRICVAALNEGNVAAVAKAVASVL